MNCLLRRLILGITSLWLSIPIVIYYFKINKSYDINLIIMTVAIIFSILYWSIADEHNIYLKYDQIFCRILFISIFLKSLYYYTIGNTIVLKLILSSGIFYIFARLQFNNGNVNHNTIIHSLFRYFGYLSIVNLYENQKYKIDMYINTFMYFGSILPLLLLNKYINVLNYYKYYWLGLIYISYVMLLFIIITDIDII